MELTDLEHWNLQNELHRTKLAFYQAQTQLLQKLVTEATAALQKLGPAPAETPPSPPPADSPSGG